MSDGHWPVLEKLPEFDGRPAIRCECGEKPAKLALRSSMRYVWHQSHRRRLLLQPVEYVWPDQQWAAAMAGSAELSRGHFVQVQGHKWERGRWVAA